MEWAYIHIASLVVLVVMALSIAAADHRLNKARQADES